MRLPIAVSRRTGLTASWGELSSGSRMANARLFAPARLLSEMTVLLHESLFFLTQHGAKMAPSSSSAPPARSYLNASLRFHRASR